MADEIDLLQRRMEKAAAFINNKDGHPFNFKVEGWYATKIRQICDATDDKQEVYDRLHKLKETMHDVHVHLLKGTTAMLRISYEIEDVIKFLEGED